ncbi:Uncharacterized BCR%2C YitT family COG1284 [Anaerotruncus sp. 2789STDY5834896]|uniref:Uncharacterized BCR, YitT family COG1284 n=1 Tax=uncultured Anaerotruncus sp. TaxID=905011 RepID=A0A1C6JK43_9FIRM|nr:Uncharacterized BCR%2C YitT family COG1284 [uncultured Anaerotruncus sp.]
MNKKLRDFLLLNLGVLLVSVGVYFFKFPNHFSTGGVSGLSILLAKLLPAVSPGTLVLVFNCLFLVLGFVLLNRSFGLKTVYCSLLFSGLTKGFEVLFPLAAPLTGERMLELVFAMALPAVGSAILFNLDASTGGTDILAMILKKFTRLDIGKALMASDALIACSTFFLFDVQTGLFSVLGLLMKSLLVDSVIENINLKKQFLIITTAPREVCGYINKNMHRGATVWQAHGAYTDGERWVILAAMNRTQANMVRKFVKIVDSHAFVLISNTSDIIGKGFRGM